MAKTTQELRISLTPKEVGEILKEALKDKFLATDSISVEFRIGTVYSGGYGDEGRETVKEIIITGTTERETKL